MRNATIATVLTAVIFWSPSAVFGQPPVKPTIEDVRIGFPTSAEEGEIKDERGRVWLHKAGFWTPIYVQIRAGSEDIAKGKVVIGSTDTDDVQNTYTVPLPPAGIKAEESLTVVTYTKNGSASGEISVTVEADNRTLEERRSFDSLGPTDALVLTMGSRLGGLRQTSSKVNANAPYQEQMRVAHLDDVRMLPNRWFGYAAVDLMIMTTGNRKFVADLIQDDKNRKEALSEWLHRGGRLVVSCGRNQDMITDLFRRMQIASPLKITGAVDLPRIDGWNAWFTVAPLKNQAPKNNPEAPTAPIPVAKVERKPGEDVEFLVPKTVDEQSPLLVARWAHGLGQVTLITFDLDQRAFVEWESQPQFWTRLFRETGLRLPQSSGGDKPNAYVYGRSERPSDLAGELQRHLEEFKDVSVISFGWVALFIVIYIIVVGPLDYFFLKKVVKRLELTWITFPSVVVVVSAVAYFGAYALKGNDLKINKVDLIDVDLTNQQIQGTTWFTLFSPRIQLYTVGVEPAAPLWTAEPGSGKKAASVVLSWMGHPEDRVGSYNRPRSQSLFRRTYLYEADAVGMTGVPIQVWSTKSFTASWDRLFGSSQPAPKLNRRPDGNGVEGSLTNPLPAVLEDAALILAGGASETRISQAKIYPLGTIDVGQRKNLGAIQSSSGWDKYGFSASPTRGGSAAALSMKKVMFFDAVSQDNMRDSAFHHLDQSWRCTNPNVAMLVARLPHKEGPAEQVAQDPVSASRLWLGKLPSSGERRPELAGTLVQDTFVRIYLPVGPPPATEANKTK
jgi:hypothetical protein